jgi:hypothetical protein
MGAECTEHGRDPQLNFCEPCDEVSNHPDRRRRSRALRGTSKNVGRKRAASSQDVASPYARVYDSAEGWRWCMNPKAARISALSH